MYMTYLRQDKRKSGRRKRRREGRSLTHVRSNYHGYGSAVRSMRSFKSLGITSAGFSVR